MVHESMDIMNIKYNMICVFVVAPKRNVTLRFLSVAELQL